MTLFDPTWMFSETNWLLKQLNILLGVIYQTDVCIYVVMVLILLFCLCRLMSRLINQCMSVTLLFLSHIQHKSIQ